MEAARDLPGEKTYVDLLARERDGRQLRIFQGRRPRQIFWREVEMEDREGSSRREDLCRSSGEGKGRKTAGDLPG